MRPSFGLRTLEDQAMYYCHGRTLDILNEKVQDLNKEGANLVSDLLQNAMKKYGDTSEKPKITNALPGLSMHNYSIALDCFHFVDGKIFNGDNPYKFYGEQAVKLGLGAGYF